MSLQSEITKAAVATLTADVNVSSIVGSNVFFVLMPDNKDLPAITLNVSSDTKDDYLDESGNRQIVLDAMCITERVHGPKLVQDLADYAREALSRVVLTATGWTNVEAQALGSGAIDVDNNTYNTSFQVLIIARQ